MHCSASEAAVMGVEVTGIHGHYMGLERRGTDSAHARLRSNGGTAGRAVWCRY